MDTLKIAEIKYAKPDQVERYESIPLIVKLKLGNYIFGDALDLNAFLLSIKQTGLSPLFICSTCGEFSCAGYYMDIDHTSTHYIIAGQYDCINPDKKINDVTGEINWWQIQKIIEQLLVVVTGIPKTHPHLETYIGAKIPSVEDFHDALNLINSF